MDNISFHIEEFLDGSLCLSCGDSMETDLVFASGAMRGDPALDKQAEILNYIIDAIHKKQEADNGRH